MLEHPGNERRDAKLRPYQGERLAVEARERSPPAPLRDRKPAKEKERKGSFGVANIPIGGHRDEPLSSHLRKLHRVLLHALDFEAKAQEIARRARLERGRKPVDQVRNDLALIGPRTFAIAPWS